MKCSGRDAHYIWGKVHFSFQIWCSAHFGICKSHSLPNLISSLPKGLCAHGPKILNPLASWIPDLIAHKTPASSLWTCYIFNRNQTYKQHWQKFSEQSLRQNKLRAQVIQTILTPFSPLFQKDHCTLCKQVYDACKEVYGLVKDHCILSKNLPSCPRRFSHQELLLNVPEVTTECDC